MFKYIPMNIMIHVILQNINDDKWNAIVEIIGFGCYFVPNLIKHAIA